jgi:hypothetical protein
MNSPLRVNYNQIGALWTGEWKKTFWFQSKPVQWKRKTLFSLPIHGRKTNRLLFPSKTNQFLKTMCLLLKRGRGRLNCFHITELGINVIINEQHKGLLYKDEVYDDAIRTGACGVILKRFVLIIKLMLLFKFKDIKASSQMPI